MAYVCASAKGGKGIPGNQDRETVSEERLEPAQRQKKQSTELNHVRCCQKVQEEGEEGSRPLPRCGDEGFPLSGQEHVPGK